MGPCLQEKSGVVLRQLAGAMQAKLSKIKRSELGANGVFLANDSTEGWLWSYACVQVIRPDIEDEPEHHDGGASLLLGSLTIWGRRQLVCRTSTGATAVEMDLQPGDVYVSPMCACRHQVLHGGHAGDLKRVKGLGSAKISVLLKCHAARFAARGAAPWLGAPARVLRYTQPKMCWWPCSRIALCTCPRWTSAPLEACPAG